MWSISLITTLRMCRQQELEFKASLGYKAKPHPPPQMEEDPD